MSNLDHKQLQNLMTIITTPTSTLGYSLKGGEWLWYSLRKNIDKFVIDKDSTIEHKLGGLCIKKLGVQWNI
jgi:hypothetical protein